MNQDTGYSFSGTAHPLCPPLWRDCTDGNISLYVQDGGNTATVQWMGGFRRATSVVHERAIIPFLAMEGTAAGKPANPSPTNICCYGGSYEVGKPCYYRHEGFGTVSLQGKEIVNGGNDLPYCVKQPIYILNGTEQIDNDQEWHAAFLARATTQALFQKLLLGEGPDSGHVDHWGLIPILEGKTQQNCPWAKAHILDWGGNSASLSEPADNITLNGDALGTEWTSNISATIFGLIQAIQLAVESNSQELGGTLLNGEIGIIGDPSAFDCFLRSAACNAWCPGCVEINNDMARQYYFSSRGGGVGHGELLYGNIAIPLIPWRAINPATGRSVWQNADGTYNFALITKSVSGRPIFYPEYNPLDNGTAPTMGNGQMQMLTEGTDASLCKKPGMRSDWRWVYEGLCYQTLIKNVKCSTIKICSPEIDSNSIINMCGVKPCKCGACAEVVVEAR